MSKIIESGRLVGEYPGLERAIQVFDDNIIEIEFNFIDSNEIGIRFWKKYNDPEEENRLLKIYFANSEARLDRQNVDYFLARKSWISLLEDTLNEKIKLPDAGYIYHGNKQELEINLKYCRENW